MVRSLLIVCLLLGAAPAVHAQGEQSLIEEIQVTARKRTEALQDIPASMNAFSEEDIQMAGIQTPHDFIALTPNVTLVQTQNAGNSFINIRGISQARNSEMSAAVLVDDVLMANPAQFNQQLFDIEQIEVLRGPQGALYGRNAIGGAITIRTKQPSDELEGIVEVGGDDGPGYKFRGAISGPISEDVRFRLAASFMDTDGFIDNRFLGEEADPYEDFSARGRLLWDITDNLRADFRSYVSNLETQALYFNIAAEANDTSLDVRTNNDGVNERDMYGFSLKLDLETEWGTLTSITAYDDLEELLTGDQFNFLPRAESFINFDPFGGFLKFLTGDAVTDLSQTQFLDTDAWSQELRFTSPSDRRVRWIVGGYFITTDRYISTGNMVDRGFGVPNVRKTPRPSVFLGGAADPSPQVGLLVDEQDNFAWAVFGEVAADLTDQLELAASLRYDKDDRENTTQTQPLFDPTGLGLVPGTKRDEDWDDLQPKVTLRYRPSENLTLYGGYSRGFRSGGFNQTGVGAAVPEPGVNDLFDEQTADTFELGLKGTFWDGLVRTSVSAYYTDFEGAYFFFFDPSTSTQNLGNIDEVTYQGFEAEVTAQPLENLTVYGGVGYTDSDIEDAPTKADEGNQAPLVTELTFNLGLQVRQPLGAGNLALVGRADWQYLGDTWWEPSNVSKRTSVNVVDFRIGVESEGDWSVMAWMKNAFDEEYNAEFSPGPAPGFNFLFKAPPRRWGVDVTKRF